MESTTSAGWVAHIERAGRWCLRHWLLCVNTLALIYAGLPWLSPLATCAGHPLIGAIIFRIYTPLCHQKPERSFFVCGHQVAFCHRCASLYGGVAALGLLFGLLRRHVPPAPLWLGGALLLPIVLDGGSHLIADVLGGGLRPGGDAIGTLNFWLRMLTGALAALGLAITVFPRVERDLAGDLAAAPARAMAGEALGVCGCLCARWRWLRWPRAALRRRHLRRRPRPPACRHMWR